MTDEIDLETIRASLREIMERKGAKPTSLSLKVGRNRSLVKDLMEKNSDVGVNTLIKLASALDVSLNELLTRQKIRVVGFIGAGGLVIFEEFDSGETVVRPPHISAKLEALMVRGDSMLPKYQDGDILYISRQVDGVLPEYLGRDCAVRLATGETYVKQLIRGSSDGTFTLLSLNAPPIVDVRLEMGDPHRLHYASGVEAYVRITKTAILIA